MGCNCGHRHSATSAHVDMAIDNNGTWEDAFQFGMPNDPNTGLPIPWSLAGQHFLMNVQVSRYDASPLLTLTTANGRILTLDATNRVVQLNVDPATIQASLPIGEYVYDFVMLDASNPNIRVPLMHGRVCVSKGVSYP